MIRIFIGYDPDQKVSVNALEQSIYDNLAKEPVTIERLVLRVLPISRKGLTEFTFSRFLVPWRCGYEGYSLFMDSDMIVRCDIAELWEAGHKALIDYRTQTGDLASVAVRNFTGREAFERASIMFFDNSQCEVLTPLIIESEAINPLDFKWANGRVASLPDQFNRLVGYEDCSDAKVLHYTAGVPCYPQVHDLGHVGDWMQSAASMNSYAPYERFMGQSVHIQNLNMQGAQHG